MLTSPEKTERRAAAEGLLNLVRSPFQLATGAQATHNPTIEAEPNDDPAKPQTVTAPCTINGRIWHQDGSAQRLSRLSPLARALQLRAVSDWVVMVACDPAARGRVAKAAPGILFGTRPRRED